MSIRAAFRCGVNGVVTVIAFSAVSARANQLEAMQTASAAPIFGDTAPQAVLADPPIAGASQNWGTRLRLAKDLSLRAGGTRQAIGSAGFCTFSGPAASTPGRCPFDGRNRWQMRSLTLALDIDALDGMTVYARTGKAYRVGAEQLRTVGMIGSADTSIVAGTEVRFEHAVGIRTQFADRKIAFNVSGYFNRVKNLQTSRTFTTPSGARFSAVINQTAMRNVGLEADLTVRAAAGMSFYGSLATNHEKLKSCAAGICAGRERDIVQTQLNVGTNYEHAFAFGTLRFNMNYNWTGRHTLPTDTATAAAIAASLGQPVGAAATAETLDGYRRKFVRRSAATLDARASLRLAGSPIELYVYGRNLTDQRYIPHRRFATDVASGSMWNEPRTVGLGAAMAF